MYGNSSKCIQVKCFVVYLKFILKYAAAKWDAKVTVNAERIRLSALSFVTVGVTAGFNFGAIS